jgi:hypothetical protein
VINVEILILVQVGAIYTSDSKSIYPKKLPPFITIMQDVMAPSQLKFFNVKAIFNV